MVQGKDNIQKPYGMPTERNTDPENAEKAFEAADKDIASDPDFTPANNPNDSMDEGELARLGEDKRDGV